MNISSKEITLVQKYISFLRDNIHPFRAALSPHTYSRDNL